MLCCGSGREREREKKKKREERLIMMMMVLTETRAETPTWKKRLLNGGRKKQTDRDASEGRIVRDKGRRTRTCACRRKKRRKRKQAKDRGRACEDKWECVLESREGEGEGSMAGLAFR